MYKSRSSFLGLPLISALKVAEGRRLPSFFKKADGSCLAFFGVANRSFAFK
jgi:hypothetical protein